MLKLFFFLFLPALLLGETYLIPEVASDVQVLQPVTGEEMMIATANPYASESGFRVLERGGSAIDAAIAASMVLGLVEPQSSGIGGGALLLYYEAKSGLITVYDGRETAPRTVDETLFLDEKGRPRPITDVIIGGRSVGVPGLVKMLELAHLEHGKIKWSLLFQDAIRLARNGFTISPRLHRSIEKTSSLDLFPTTRSYFFDEPGNRPKGIGTLLKNPKLARVYSAIAKRGSEPFYKGWIANAIVEAVRDAPINPGQMTLSDLEEYEAVERDPLFFNYGDYRIATVPPPSAGGVAIGQILGMLEYHDLPEEFSSPELINLFCGASRLAFADRNYYLADSDFFPAPVERLLDPDYLRARAALLHPDQALTVARHGKFPGDGVACCPPLSLANEMELPSTTQICVVDAEGNIVSMTNSIENAFGSTLMVEGFLLNNELTDFSLIPEKDGAPVANRVQPGKRPLSSMTPTLVFDQKTYAPRLAVGSAGGARIIDYVAQTILGNLTFDLGIQAAIAFPHFIGIEQTIELEEDTFIVDEAPALEVMGNQVVIRPQPSGLAGIAFEGEKMIGGVDPRREGLVLGK